MGSNNGKKGNTRLYAPSKMKREYSESRDKSGSVSNYQKKSGGNATVHASADKSQKKSGGNATRIHREADANRRGVSNRGVVVDPQKKQSGTVVSPKKRTSKVVSGEAAAYTRLAPDSRRYAPTANKGKADKNSKTRSDILANNKQSQSAAAKTKTVSNAPQSAAKRNAVNGVNKEPVVKNTQKNKGNMREAATILAQQNNIGKTLNVRKIKGKSSITETPEAKQRRLERKRRRRYAIALCLSVAGIIVGIIMVTAYVFSVKKITVIGAQRYDSDYIIEMSGLKKGMNLLLADIGEAADKLNSDPYINVNIQKKLPNEFVIIISENRERACIECGDTVAVIDAEGYVLLIGGLASEHEGVVIVKGMGTSGLRVGTRIAEIDDYRAHALFEVLEAIDEAQLAITISSIDMSNPIAISMVTADGLNVYLGDSDEVSEKLASLPRLVQEVYNSGYGLGVLDISMPGRPVYMRDESEMPQNTQQPQTTQEYVGTQEPNESPTPSEMENALLTPGTNGETPIP